MYLKVFWQLTEVEILVVKAAMKDESAKAIAAVLKISPRTVETHKSNVRKKLNMSFHKRRNFISELAKKVEPEEYRYFPAFYREPDKVAEALRPHLSPQENRLIFYLGQGLLQKEMAERLNVNVRTLESYCSRIKEKLGLPKDLKRLHLTISEWYDKQLQKEV